MDYSFWQKQSPEKPLYPDLLWSRPENRAAGGKLLIIGGSLHGFASVAESFGAAMKAQAGSIRVLLPDKLKSTLSKLFPAAEFAPSTPSGSFAASALDGFLDEAQWADGVLVSGDIGKNSETAILLEKFVGKYKGQLALTTDAVDNFMLIPAVVLNRGSTCLVVSGSQLQQIVKAARYPSAITSDMDLVQFVTVLHEFSKVYQCSWITEQSGNVVVASNGQLITTKLGSGVRFDPVSIAATGCTWLLQNPGKVIEALSCAIYSLII